MTYAYVLKYIWNQCQYFTTLSELWKCFFLFQCFYCPHFKISNLSISIYFLNTTTHLENSCIYIYAFSIVFFLCSEALSFYYSIFPVWRTFFSHFLVVGLLMTLQCSFSSSENMFASAYVPEGSFHWIQNSWLAFLSFQRLKTAVPLPLVHGLM